MNFIIVKKIERKNKIGYSTHKATKEEEEEKVARLFSGIGFKSISIVENGSLLLLLLIIIIIMNFFFFLFFLFNLYIYIKHVYKV